MPKKTTGYTNESIVALKGADRVRKRPSVIFGSDGLEGCQHSIFEIISNSIDEARDGYGNKIIITRYADGSVECEDFGRGLPVDFNSNEQRYNWELLFCELYAGGKYDDGGDSYEFSLGLNGLGLCSTQYSSEYMDAEIYRDGFRYVLHFEKGENVGGLTKEPTKKRQTGTRIKWKPDLEVFTEIAIPIEYYRDTIRRQSVVNPGVVFVLRNQIGNSFEEEQFYYENGISDYLAELVGDQYITPIQTWNAERKGRDRADMADYKVKLSAAFCFSNKMAFKEHYHNSSWLEYGGSPEKAVKAAFVNQIDNWLKSNNKYLKDESKITYADIEPCLVFISSNFSTQASYENQTKKAITNRFVYEAMNEFLRHGLEVYFTENPDDAQKIAQQVMVNKRSRESAEKARINIKKKLEGSIDMANRVQKFVDCRTKDVTRREIFIVEGDSALGSCKMGRDAEFQAIMPVRGKILNCLKAEYDRIFKSDIITDVIKVLGCGVDVKSKANKELSLFDIEKLRWNKIIICTDADVDGFQIRTLILTMIYRLTPQLIDQGYVYIAETPLYEINSNDKTWFVYSDAEKNKIVEENKDKKLNIQRSKGLGENEADMMWLTTMNPDTRRLIRITPEEAEATAEIFDLLLGDNLAGRKDYIAANGHLYLDELDLS
ncbi:MAG: DNA topoisomerase [Oscillospiraceae bacterium]|nr:DNA topoisomerase [Oscillospiraceae bacterium]